MNDVTEISVDLEFNNNLHYYGVKICLLQIAFDNLVFLLDTNTLDIKPLFKHLEDEKIRKNVFSFEEDLRILHSLGCNPRNLFDISIGAKLLNLEKISLADVVEHFLHISLEKGEQTSNWCIRPLSFEQLKYAAGDVIHLSDVADLVIKQTTEKGIYTWLEEENLAIEKLVLPDITQNQIPSKYKQKMNELEWFYYQKIWRFREEKAKIMNLPAFKVIANDVLLEIATEPSLINNWLKMKNMNPKLKKPHVFDEVREYMYLARKEAMESNLSSEKPARKPLEKSEYLRLKEETRKADVIIEKYLKPVQEQLKNDFGERAALFVLSNRIMNDLARGDKSSQRNYRHKLVKEYLNRLNLSWDF